MEVVLQLTYVAGALESSIVAEFSLLLSLFPRGNQERYALPLLVLFAFIFLRGASFWRCQEEDDFLLSMFPFFVIFSSKEAALLFSGSSRVASGLILCFLFCPNVETDS